MRYYGACITLNHTLFGQTLANSVVFYATNNRYIQAMDQRRFPYGIRMTVTDAGIESLARSVEFLCRETACGTFQVEPAFDHGRASQEGLALTHHQCFATAFMEAYDIAVSYGRHLYYSGARPWLITSQFCQAIEKALVVTPDGLLTACYEVCGKEHALVQDFFFGALSRHGTINMDPEVREQLYERIGQRRTLCEDCFCYWHCAGDCPAKTLTSKLNGHLSFGERCDLNRVITKEVLIRYITAGGGVWQREKPAKSLLMEAPNDRLEERRSYKADTPGPA